jgi:uncharacterized protein YukE
MSVATDSGTVDLSGVVGSILRRYQGALANCQQVVTGDPGALTNAATSASDQANNLAAVAGTVQQQAQSLGMQWEGSAFDAFHGSTGNLATELDAVRDTLVQEAQRLSSAATALTNSKSAMDSVLSQFTSAANQLLAESSAASPAAVNAFINAAEQLGQSAVKAATSIIEQLGSALAGIFGLSAEPAVEGETEEEKKKFGNTESDQKKAVQKWLANQPWFKSWYKNTYGKNPDPEHLKFGALNWFDENDVLDGRRRPKSAPWSTFTNSGWYKVTSDGFTPTSAPLKANTPFGSLADPPEDASTATKLLHDSNVTLWSSGDNTVYNGADHGLGYEVKDNGKLDMGSYGTLSGKADFDAGLQVTDNASVNIHGGQLQASGDLKGTLVDATASGTYKDGILGADGKVDGFVGGDLSGHFTGGINGGQVGGELHLNAFAGAQVSGSASADVGGLGVGVNGSLQAGVGAQLDGQATWNNGDVKVNFRAGAALGLGASIGGNVEVNLPKMWDNVQQYGNSVVNSVSGAASSAADAIGRAATNASAGGYWGGW